MADKKDRIFWIDLYRLVVIIFITVNHVPPRMGEIFHDWNHYLVVTPSFFLSGYLFNSAGTSSFWEYVKRKSRTLLRPTLVFFFFFYLLWLLGGKALAHDEDIAWYQPLIEMATGRPHTITAAMWYVVALIVMQPVYFLLNKALPEKWILPLCLLVGCASTIVPTPRFWQFDQVLLFLPVYALGVRCKRGGSLKSIPLYALFLGCVVGAATFTYFEYDSVPYLLALCPFVLVFTFTAVRLIIEFTQWYDRILPHYNWMSVIGGNTIIVVAAQNYVIGILKIGFDHILGTHGFLEEHAILKVPVGLLVIALLYPLVLFIVKKVPWVLGKKKG